MKKKIGLFIVWIFILEVMLHATAFVVQSWNRQSNKPAAQSTFKILCLGESTTGLGGDLSYPSMLEKALDAKSASDKFTVINAGMPGKDSSDILNQAEALITEHKPDVGIVMVGVNDYWNLPDREMKWWESTLESMSAYSRIAKIIRLSVINYEVTPPTPEAKDVAISTCNQGPLYSAPQYQSQKSLEALVNRKITSYDIYLNLADIYRKNRETEKALSTLALGITRLNPYGYCGDSFLLQEKMIEIYQKDVGDKKAALEKIEEFLDARMISYYRFKMIDIRDRIRAELGLSAAPAKVLTYWENRTFKKNLQDIVKEFQIRKIPVLVMQYPRLPVAPLKRILIDHNGVTFVENIDNFEKVLRTKKYDEVFSDSFAHVFGHMTALGAQTMAEGLVPVIMELSENK